MRILVPVDIGDFRTSNPFVVEMLKSLQSHSSVHSVQHGVFWLDVPDAKWDIVHIQWPESLCPGVEPQQEHISRLREQLAKLKPHARIVVTVHNLSVHYRHSAAFDALYRTVFEAADAFVHFSDYSIELIHQSYYEVAEGKPHIQIPHGNYECFGNAPTQLSARKQLNLPSHKTILLVFGQLRAFEEFALARSAIKHWPVPEKTLLICGRLPVRPLSMRLSRLMLHIVGGLRTFVLLLRSKLTRNLILHEKRVAADEVAAYCTAADIFLIPRKEILNSGNIALGFTYGKVVVGPDVGNVGEILKRHENPVFDPDSIDSLISALSKALVAARSGRGDSNRKIAIEKWNWGTVAEMHVNLYEDLLGREKRV